MRRILYAQYAVPGAYPPIEHSAKILAAAGWKIRMLGRAIEGVDSFVVEGDTPVDVRLLRATLPGPLLKLHYAWFLVWCLWHALVWRASWLYTSDVMAVPLGLLARTLPWVRVVYHEHDEPGRPPRNWLERRLRATRVWLVRNAEVVITPNETRSARLAAAAGTDRRVDVVWNCPTRDEVRATAPAAARLRVIYHGSINEARLPLTLVGALVQVTNAELVIVGYETAPGYLARFSAEATRLGASDRVTIVGALATRGAVLDVCATCDVGFVAFREGSGDDANQLTMVGASNKAFDYLACGIPFLVVDFPAWRETFVEPGYAIPCDPSDVGSVAQALAWCVANRQALREMGQRGRERVISEWNYESQFASVLEVLEGRAA